MKNQYFGDVNDYRKYGLLRILAGGALRTGVCWMLTPDDGRTDGRRIQYLDAPDTWRKYDPPLFDCLRECVRVEGARSVLNPRLPALLPRTDFHAALLTDSPGERREYFANMLAQFRDADLVFFDPDNGLEVASVPRGRKNSSKYLYWDEAAATFAAGHSVLVYQHFPRVEHSAFIARLAAEMRARTGTSEVRWFSTSYVVYFLAGPARHAAHFGRQARSMAETWQGEFEVGISGE